MPASIFAGQYNAILFNYGGVNKNAPQDPPQVVQGNSVGASTIQASANSIVTNDSYQFAPFATNAPIIIGLGASLETVTPTSVGVASDTQFAPIDTAISISATFSFAHGPQDQISSGTYGLQEAINFAASNGGGKVIVDASWYAMGGTAAIIAAATVPTFLASASGATGLVQIVDLQSFTIYNYGPNSVTVVAAPVAATSATVASQPGVVGTWTAITEHVLFTYVTADGGESLASPDYSFTATVSLAIGGSGPAASTGAVGYRVYIGANATTTCYLVPAIAANGTVIQCGPLAAFKLGTPFSVATATVAAALAPVQSSAFPVGFQPASAGLPGSTIVEGPFAVTGVVTAATAAELGVIQLPAGFLNRVNRTLRITLQGIWTPVSTAVLILSATVGSVYNTTETTVYTITSAASTGTTAADWQTVFILRTATTGATGTIEAHGQSVAALVTGTPNLATISIDTAQAASGAIDLTKQDYIRFLINSSAANITQSQLRTAIIEVLN